ncbi:MAG TPA: ferredoxin [Myxococcales bacterium]|nr:ferredoxin [Myxococcales bacterium]HIM01654.1 ferredoxin [Myxococcales bacterium]
MKIRLDPERCTGHGRCYVLAPEVFDEDDAGRCVLKHAAVPSELHEQARKGVESCPEHALVIEETGAVTS